MANDQPKSGPIHAVGAAGGRRRSLLETILTRRPDAATVQEWLQSLPRTHGVGRAYRRPDPMSDGMVQSYFNFKYPPGAVPADRIVLKDMREDLRPYGFEIDREQVARMRNLEINKSNRKAVGWPTKWRR